MAVITKEQLENASRDANDLAAVVNGGPTDPDVVTREGGAVPTLAKMVAAITVEEETATASAALAVAAKDAAVAAASSSFPAPVLVNKTKAGWDATTGGLSPGGITVFSKTASPYNGWVKSVTVNCYGSGPPPNGVAAKVCVVAINGDGTARLVASQDFRLYQYVNKIYPLDLPIAAGQFLALYTAGSAFYYGTDATTEGLYYTVGLPGAATSGGTAVTTRNDLTAQLYWEVESDVSHRAGMVERGDSVVTSLAGGPINNAGGTGAPGSTGFVNTATYFHSFTLKPYDQIATKLEVDLGQAGGATIYVARLNADGTVTKVSSQAVQLSPALSTVTLPIAIPVPAGCFIGLQLNGAGNYYSGTAPQVGGRVTSTTGAPGTNTAASTSYTIYVQHRFTLVGDAQGKADAAYDNTLALRNDVGITQQAGWPSPIATTGTDVPGTYTVVDTRPAPADGFVTQARIGSRVSGSVKVFTCSIDPSTLTLTLKNQVTASVVAGLNTISLNLAISAGDLVGFSSIGTAGTMLFQNGVNPLGIAGYYSGSSVSNGMTVLAATSQHRFEVQATIKTGLLANSAGGTNGTLNTGLDTLAGADTSGDFADELAAAYSSHPHPYLRPGTYNATSLPAFGAGLWGPGKLFVNGVYVSIPPAPERGTRFLKLRGFLAGVIATGSCLIFMGDSITNGAYATSHRSNHVGLMARYANLGIALDEAIMGSFDDSDPSGGLAFHGITLANPGTATQGTGGPVGKSLMLQPGQSMSLAAAAYERVDVTYTGVTGGTLVFAFNGSTYKTVNCATSGQDVLAAAGATGQTASGVYSITNTGSAAVEITSLMRFGVKVAGSKPRLHVCRFARGGWSFGSYSAAQIASAVRIATAVAGGTNHFVCTGLGTNDSVGSSTTYAALKTAATNHANLWIAQGVTADRQMPIIPWRWSYYLGTTTYEMAQGGVRDGFRAAGVTRCAQTDGYDFVLEGMAGDGHPNDTGFQAEFDAIVASMCGPAL